MLERPQSVVCSVVHTGCIKNVTLTKHAGNTSSQRLLRIELMHAIEPDEHYAIVWWNQDGSYILLQPEPWEMRPGTIHWQASVPLSYTDPIAIAAAYAGAWIGSWYQADWSQILASSTAEAKTISVLMRWFHLPLLSQDVLSQVAQFANAHAVDTLPIWLTEQCPLPDLQFTRSDEGWLAAIRKIFLHWYPKHDVAQLVARLTDASLAHNPLDQAEQLVWRLSRISPLLMANVFRAWIQDVCIPQWGKPQCITLLHFLPYQLAEVSSEAAFAKRKTALLQELADTMQIDFAFIERTLIQRAIRLFHRQDISAIDHDNIAVAMQVEPFRRLLSMYLLEMLYQEFRGL